MSHRPSLTGWRAAAAMAAAVVLAVAPASAGTGVDLNPPPASDGGGHPRLDTGLSAIARGEGPPTLEFVDVEVFPVFGRRLEVSASLRDSRAHDLVTVGEMISARLPVAAIEGLGRNPQVAWAQVATTPFAEVVSQGVAVIDADDWHAAGFDGSGVKVAVIDLGFAGYQTRQAEGELPQGLTTRDDCETTGFEGTSHGTGVAEIVHDVAPGASLYLICVESIGDLSQAVTYAAAQGIRVINHSVGWFNTGRGDGSGSLQPIFQAARTAGILWVNSAGNYAEAHWSGTFADTDADLDLDFPGGGDTLRVVDYAGNVSVTMKWDEWPTSDLDYNLELYRDDGATMTRVAWSEDEQSGSQPPTEQLTYSGPVGEGLHIKVVKAAGGGETPQIDVFVLNSDLHPDDYVSARSLNDPATSPLVTAVAAAHHTNSTVEPFSSRGPTIDARTKPDLSGPDGVSNKTFGAFGGTSAAAPHIAGAAALIRQANPGITATDLHGFLISKTRPGFGQTDTDNDYGAGILDLGVPQSQPVGLVDPASGQWHLRQGSVSQSFYFGNPGDYPFMGDWDCNGTVTPGLYRQSDGFAYLRNSNTQGNADIAFFFGNPGDIPIVGDFNNDSCDTVSIYRPSQARFYIVNALGTNGGGLGPADYYFDFGNPGDQPFSGDFDADGFDEVGLHRASTGLVYFEDELIPNSGGGQADHEFFFGNPGDRFVAGDWNTNGSDSPAVFRPANTTFYFRYTNTQGNADEISVWGSSTWVPVSGGDFGM